MELQQQIKTLAKTYLDEIIAIRRHMHQYPELSYHEAETSAYIIQQLQSLGVPYSTGWAEHGIVVTIEGALEGPTRFLRADIDALPIFEERTHAYSSTRPGVMHACGHDAHTASLLGCIKILLQLKNQLRGTVHCVFQPAEEKLPGGASIMLEEGLFDQYPVDYMLGQHVEPSLPAGMVGLKAGPYMASADELYFTIQGKGGHAAMPQNFRDPIVSAAFLIAQLQTIISRDLDPKYAIVLSIGNIKTPGGATNIIPERVYLEGTLRTFDEETRYKVHDRIRAIAEGVAQAYGTPIEADIKIGYPSLYNNPELTESTKTAMIEYLGADKVVDLPMRMTAEDFAYYAQRVPACFYRLGTRNEAEGITAALHTPQFDIDESALEIGMGLMAWLAMKG